VLVHDGSLHEHRRQHGDHRARLPHAL
jgi:hypothetical protein